VEALERSGYIKPMTAASAQTKVRRRVRRLNLTAGSGSWSTCADLEVHPTCRPGMIQA